MLRSDTIKRVIIAAGIALVLAVFQSLEVATCP